MFSISFFIASLISLVIYIVFTSIVYVDNYQENYNFANHFAFELYIKKGHRFIYLNIFLYLVAALYTGNFIVYAIKDFSAINAIIAILALLTSFSFIAIFYLPLTKLKEKCFCSIGYFVSIAGTNGLIIYQEIRNIRIYENNLYFIPLAFSILVLLFSLFAIFNPKIFDFNAPRNQEGVQVRPKIFHLALAEWLLIFTFLFSQFYLMI